MSAKQAVGARPEAARASPLAPLPLFQLFFQPGRYFSRLDRLGRGPEVVLVAWACGLAVMIDAVGQRVARAELGQSSSLWNRYAAWLLDSWPHYWLLVLVLGALGAVAMLFLGGWFYRLRLHECGATHADKRSARMAYVYQEFVFASAVLVTGLAQTWLFADYKSALEASPPWAGLPLVFAFWSCWTSYSAAIYGFGARRGKALAWFFVLPALCYAVPFGLAVSMLLPTTGAPA